jgi:hypothetical protein
VLIHKKVLRESSKHFFAVCALTLQVIDFAQEIYCLPNGHFVETRIVQGLRGVKGVLSTKLCTMTVDI